LLPVPVVISSTPPIDGASEPAAAISLCVPSAETAQRM
jgi:hypothetical protein